MRSPSHRHWGAQAKAIVIEPEVDVWMWGSESHLRSIAGWEFREGIRDWLAANGFTFNGRGKPTRPKEALDAVFRRAQVSRSSSHYAELARRLSLKRCGDDAFRRLHGVLRTWFAPDQPDQPPWL